MDNAQTEYLISETKVIQYSTPREHGQYQCDNVEQNL